MEWLRLFVVYLILLRKIGVHSLKIGQDYDFHHPFPFIPQKYRRVVINITQSLQKNSVTKKRIPKTVILCIYLFVYLFKGSISTLQYNRISCIV